tara:strand:+ start:616 stop:816 length:201 start_codon:yes stop_codon:yes gene_type:complete
MPIAAGQMERGAPVLRKSEEVLLKGLVDTVTYTDKRKTHIIQLIDVDAWVLQYLLNTLQVSSLCSL